MLDFNSSSSLSGRLTALVDLGMQRTRATQPRRAYLGASRLGASCERALQYEYADAPVDTGPSLLRGRVVGSNSNPYALLLGIAWHF